MAYEVVIIFWCTLEPFELFDANLEQRNSIASKYWLKKIFLIKNPILDVN